MRISSISVHGLFGLYDHELKFSDEGLTFIHSMNGVGKSTTLNMLADIFEGDVDSLFTNKFEDIELTFNDGSIVRITNDRVPTITKDGLTKEISVIDLISMANVTYLSAERNMHYIGKDLAVPSAEFLMKELDGKVDTGLVDKDMLEMLIDSLNTLYTTKRAYINETGHLRIMVEDKIELPIDKLSSGEKQVFIMFYTILFDTQKGSLVIIDEPEISLHIAWQKKLCRLFLQFCEAKDLQMIVATHSPAIIHDRWDLAREMGIGRA